MSPSNLDFVPLGAMVPRYGALRAELLIWVGESFWACFLAEAPWPQGSHLSLGILVFEGLRKISQTYSWWVTTPFSTSRAYLKCRYCLQLF